jgi:hypothetical protein
VLYADEVLAHIPPRSQPHQLSEVMRAIHGAKPQRQSNAARALPQAAELCKHRGIVVVLSDLFDDTQYCSVLSASRCRGVRYRNFGFGVSSNGNS